MQTVSTGSLGTKFQSIFVLKMWRWKDFQTKLMLL